MDIWKKDEEIYKLSKLTKEDILMAEDYFNVTLPQQYINLLKVQNVKCWGSGALAYILIQKKELNQKD